MKVILVILICILVNSKIMSQTYVSGGIYADTTWTKDNSPYIVTDNIVIFENVTLTIEPGVLVKFYNDTEIESRGVLNAIGNIQDTIVFSSNSSTPVKSDWKGIRITHSNDIQFEYLKIQYAEIGLFKNNEETYSAQISSCSFIDNEIAMQLYAYRNSTIDECFFSRNNTCIPWCNRAGVVSNSIFQDNINGIENFYETILTNCQFINNTGTALVSFRAHIYDNMFKGNNVGMDIKLFTGSDVNNNVITENNIGLKVKGEDGSPVENFKCNQIYNNNSFNVVNENNISIDLSHNCWDNDNIESIEATIYDGYDDISLGLILLEQLYQATIQLQLPDTIAICNGTDVEIYPEVTANYLSYVWIDLNNDDTISNNNFLSVNKAGNYLLQVKTCCSSNEKYFTVIESKKPSSEFDIDKSVDCTNNPILLSVLDSVSKSAKFDWILDGGNIQNQDGNDFYVSWDNSGEKDISLIITDNYCISDIFTRSIRINQSPILEIDSPESVCEQNSIALNYTGSGSDSAEFIWNFDDAIIESGEGKGPYELRWPNSGLKTISLLVNDNGCSSDTSINFIVLSKSDTTIDLMVCDSYTSPSGNYTWTNSGTYEDIIPNTAGCDSIITFNLTVNKSTTSTIDKIVCNSYTSPSGNNTWTNSGTYEDIIPNAAGCDSIITINLTVNKSTYSTITETVCDSYNSPSGNYTWNSSGTYEDIIPNSNGCDSIITINLTVVNINTEVELLEGGILTAMEDSALYQWEVCTTGNIINGATSKSYKPIISGLYAVKISKEGCEATSSCYSFILSDVGDVLVDNFPIAYPNPVFENLTIELKKYYNEIELEIIDVSGKTISKLEYLNLNRIELKTLSLKEGLYVIKLKYDQNETRFKILKK